MSTDLSRPDWRKSSRSNTAPEQCVEVANLGRAVAVRDSVDPGGPELIIGSAGWSAFLARAKAGALDL
ncbi:DUF397 domain-containing protein [Actinomadura scrupuli]|uniref:DUF397 domain-containing protein n=1 Tax=Actinomadura scrupuli TaxID=559629 RepID=UPI003D99C6C5